MSASGKKHMLGVTTVVPDEHAHLPDVHAHAEFWNRTWDGQGRFCNIRGHDNQPVARGNALKHSCLGRPGQHGIQRQHMHGTRPCPLLFWLVLCASSPLKQP
jgi:hypothetical protein